MKKRVLRTPWLLLGIGCLLVLMLTGTSVHGTAVTEGSKQTDRSYSITAYWTVHGEFSQSDGVKYMKESGLDTIAMYSDPWGQGMSGGRVNYQALIDCANQLGEAGLKFSVNDGRIANQIEELKALKRLPITDETKEKEWENKIPGEIQRLKRESNNWEGVTNLAEFFITDEPPAQEFEGIGKLKSEIQKQFPGISTFINLLPSYATCAQLGTSDYVTYVDRFVREVDPDYLGTDYYVFTESGRRAGIAENMEVLKDAAAKYPKNGRKLPLRLIVRCSSGEGMYPNLTDAELSWQANFALLYGVKQLSWYTYSHPDGEPTADEMIDVNHQRTSHYYAIQKINADNRVLGNALMDTDVDQVFYTGDAMDGLSEYTSYGKLGTVTRADNLLLSFYDDKDFLFVMNNVADKKGYLISDTLENYGWLNPETGRWESLETCAYYENSKLSIPAGKSVLLRSMMAASVDPTPAEVKTPKLYSTTITKAKSSKKKTVIIQWKKSKGAPTGYQIRYGTKESMKGAKTLFAKASAAGKKGQTVRKLKSKKKYYFQIRSMKKANGKNYYGPWSKKKTVKVK